MESLLTGLTRLRSVTAQEVFDIWRNNEETREWQQHYQKRGFQSWEEWRRTYTTPLRFFDRSWVLYTIDCPGASIPAFRGGPFRSWHERFYEGRSAPTFAELAAHPGIRRHSGIRRLVDHFPGQTTLIGIMADVAGGAGVVIIEGMHRCAAAALAEEEGRHIEARVEIALADYEPGELPIVGQVKKL